MNTSPIQRAIDLAGGPTALADKIGGGVQRQHIVNWRRRGVPADRCIDVETAVNGAVTRYELRPDVFTREGEPPARRTSAATEGNLAAEATQPVRIDEAA